MVDIIEAGGSAKSGIDTISPVLSPEIKLPTIELPQPVAEKMEEILLNLHSLEDIIQVRMFGGETSKRDTASRAITEKILSPHEGLILAKAQCGMRGELTPEQTSAISDFSKAVIAYCQLIIEKYKRLDAADPEPTVERFPAAPPEEPALPVVEEARYSVADMLSKIQNLEKENPPELSSTDDQVARRFVPIENLIETAGAHFSPTEKTEIQKRLILAKANVYARALFHRIAGLEADSKGWSFFDDSEGGIFGPAVLNKIEDLRIYALTNGFDAERDSVAQLLAELRKSFSLIKGAYGYWQLAGTSIIGNLASDGGGVSRKFPSLEGADENMVMDGAGIGSFIKERMVVSGEVVNDLIERRPRELTEEKKREFELNVEFERGDDFLPEDIVLKDGTNLHLANETTNGWLMRMFDKLMRHDFKAKKSAFIDPKSGRRIDSFEIAGQNVEDLIDYVCRKAQAYELPITVTQVRRAFRFWAVLTINHGALAPHPTGISDQVYQTFHWTSYLAKEWAYGNLDGVIEPMLSLSLIGDQDSVHPLDLFIATKLQDSIQSSLLHSLAMKGVVDGGGLFATFRKKLGPVIKKIVAHKGDKEVEVERVVGPAKGYAENQKLIAAFFNLPMIDAADAPWDIEPPLEYFTSDKDGVRKKMTDYEDKNGNYIYEAMPLNQVSVMNYYRDLANKAMGFVKNFFHSGWEDFAGKVDSRDLTDLFKNIQYTLQFIPQIGHDVRFPDSNEFSMRILKQSSGPDDPTEYELHLTPNEVEDFLRFLVLVQYVIIKMKYQEKTKWTAAKAQEWARDFFKTHPNYFAKSSLLGDSETEKIHTAKKILEEIAVAMEPFLQKMVKAVAAGTTQAAEVARRTA